jgi:hypothetical protein
MGMKSRALTARLRWTSGQKRGGTVLSLAFCLALLAFWAGCGDEETQPTFPTRPQPEPDTWLFGVWGTGPDDVFIVGQPGIIRHWNGSSWQSQESRTEEALTSVWGRSATEVYACGHRGVILRHNGSSWSAMNSGTSKNLFAIGSYQDAVHCAGKDGELRRLNGGSWSGVSNFVVRRNPTGDAVIDTLERNRDINSLTIVTHYGNGGSDGIVLMVDDGIEEPVYEWRARILSAGAEWIQAGYSDPDIVGRNYLATDGGRIYQLRLGNDQQLSWLELSGLNLEQESINGIWADEGDTLYMATRSGKVWQRNPEGDISLFHDGSKMLYDIWGSAPDDIYAVGIRGIVIHWDGTTWEEIDINLPVSKQADSVKFATESSESIMRDKFGRLIF